MKRIYLDNGATTKVASEVIKAMEEFYSEKYGNASSLHSFGREARDAVEEAREIIAAKINAEPEEIIFTSSGSEANNLALKGFVLSSSNKKSKKIVTTKIEHASVLNTCKFLEKNGFDVVYLNVDDQGFVDLLQLEKEVKDALIVSIIHGNNEIGTIQELDKIAKICNDASVPLHIDAVQSFCKVDIDVKKHGLAFASLSAHKIHGPKGIGALFIRQDLKKRLVPLIHGGSQEFNLRAGTENVPNIVGFAKASQLISKEDIERMKQLRDYLIDKLLEIEATRLNGAKGDKRLCNNVNISFAYVEGESLLLQLDADGIAVSTGSACSSHELKPSHVLTAIGLPHEIAHGSLRFTLSKYTTKEEIDYVVEKVKQAVERLRKISPLGK